MRKENAKEDKHTWIELVIANIYWKTTDDWLNAITPNTQVTPNIGITAPKVFAADLQVVIL